MRWFSIKRNAQDQKNKEVTVATIRAKLKHYQPTQSRSEFVGRPLAFHEPFSSLSTSSPSTPTSLDYVKVSVNVENPDGGKAPFSIH